VQFNAVKALQTYVRVKYCLCVRKWTRTCRC